MNPSKSLRTLLLAALLTFTGCITGPQPPASARHRLVQLNDYLWTDTSDVREIYFSEADPATNNTTATPYAITLVHRGTGDNSFKYTFTDQASAYDSWKRLVKYLGGSLQEDDWKPASAAPPVTVTASTKPSQPPAVAESLSYSQLRQDLNALAACRDEKLITPEEYDRGRSRILNNFTGIVARGNDYNSVCGALEAELAQVEAARKNRLLDDDAASWLHGAILIRYDLATR